MNTKKPMIYLTDYRSYNSNKPNKCEGWIDLTKFRDYKDFKRKVNRKMLKCTGYSDIELMVTDTENIPDALYSENMDFEILFAWLALDDDEKVLFTYLKDNYYYDSEASEILDAMDDYGIIEYQDDWEYDYLEEVLPEVAKMVNKWGFLSIDEDVLMLEMDLTKFKYQNEKYIIEKR